MSRVAIKRISLLLSKRSNHHVSMKQVNCVVRSEFFFQFLLTSSWSQRNIQKIDLLFESTKHPKHSSLCHEKPSNHARNATFANDSPCVDMAFHVPSRRVCNSHTEGSVPRKHAVRFDREYVKFLRLFEILYQKYFDWFRFFDICIYGCNWWIWIDLFDDRSHSNAASNWWYFHEPNNNLQLQ